MQLFLLINCNEDKEKTVVQEHGCPGDVAAKNVDHLPTATTPTTQDTADTDETRIMEQSTIEKITTNPEYTTWNVDFIPLTVEVVVVASSEADDYTANNNDRPSSSRRTNNNNTTTLVDINFSDTKM